ncbi:MAG TPA: arginine--tRNA ligase [Candidatus Angelobacter sp.]|nr:arginine--tRNA ligase [Candidatus Angelobacter sp.]
MYLELRGELEWRVVEAVQRLYGLDLREIVVDQPPEIALGEYALPLSFELAKKLRKPPRKIAEEIVAALGAVPGFVRLEVAGAGYINAHLDRQSAASRLFEESLGRSSVHYHPIRILVEHTSINPNKAAHIGHLRNAILGDTFVHLLTTFNAHVWVQNYIDNTGVQVADVVVGFLYLEKKGKAEIEKLIASTHPRFDYYCWDLYAEVSQWYEQDKDRLKLRLRTLHEIEQGGNEAAEIGRLISDAIVRRHLQTMQRLNIQYDFLPQESEILHLHFWELAFAQLKQKGVVYLETEGKNKGCWVMRRAGSKPGEQEGPDEDAKVIVRSNGTVTYVGKDIAYHLWKFGLLGRDFGYKRFYHYPNGYDVWISAESGEPEHPIFGNVRRIYNVIDARQSDAQNNVIEALRALGYTEEADHFHHFSYGMVVLTPASAVELGFEVSEEDRKRSHIELSGRKGFGVKADDLIDALIAAAQREVDARHQELNESERRDIATQIAVSALRYFMLKFTKNSLIAFDLKEALNFEGETGPYVQYAVVRATNIFRKAGTTDREILSSPVDLRFLDDEGANEIWQLWLIAGQLSSAAGQCVATTEPAYIAKYAFQLAQQFNNFYHKHHILSEADPARKQFLLATAVVVRQALIRSLALMGITVPPVM